MSVTTVTKRRRGERSELAKGWDKAALSAAVGCGTHGAASRRAPSGLPLGGWRDPGSQGGASLSTQTPQPPERKGRGLGQRRAGEGHLAGEAKAKPAKAPDPSTEPQQPATDEKAGRGLGAQGLHGLGCLGSPPGANLMGG